MAGGAPSAQSLAFVKGVCGAWSDLRSGRDALAWRKTRDPWLTLIAEFMLAQTQVSRVEPHFVAMAERFPTPRACADAPQAEVVARWVGLGYNRRAVQLHRCARQICERHGGTVPSELESLLGLPGVGPYTARAIRAFAFGEHAGVVDTNIRRVLARAVMGHGGTPKDLQALADELVGAQDPREWNLALMDFGSLVCRSRAPRCVICPLLRAGCAWRDAEQAAGSPLDDPASGPSTARARQTAFSGSDRQGRGRLVRRASLGPIGERELAEAAGWPEEPDRALKIAEQLILEGVLARARTGNYQLA